MKGTLENVLVRETAPVRATTKGVILLDHALYCQMPVLVSAGRGEKV